MATVTHHGYPQDIRPASVNYVSAETICGDHVIPASFKSHLESYFKKAPPEDKAKCLELLTSINIQEQINGKDFRSRSVTPTLGQQQYHYSPVYTPEPPKRPKTAMAALDRPKKSFLSPYMTSYEREFVLHQNPDIRADRPSSTKKFPYYPSGGTNGPTTYSVEYFAKKPSNTVPLRSGTASGNRRNNPHPDKAFMEWRFPRNYQEPTNKLGEPLTDEVMDRVCRGKNRTTYQQDYLGIPHGAQVQEAIDLPPDWKANIPVTLDSCKRYSYRTPIQEPELAGNTKRYGCNKSKMVTANGIMPTCSTRYKNLRNRTTYERDISDVASNFHYVSDLRTLGKELSKETLQKYLDSADLKERENINKMLQSMEAESRRNSGLQNRRSRCPVATPTYKPPEWLSTWSGPM